MATKRIYLYPIWIRLWHALNALMFLVLIITGISLHYATAGIQLYPVSGFSGTS